MSVAPSSISMEAERASAQAAAARTASSGVAVGLFKSISNLASTLVALVQTRLELLTTELQEEVGRVGTLVIWAFVALLATMIGLFFVGFTIILAYWDTHRLLAASLVTGFFVVAAIVAVLVLVSKINSHPRFLDATLNELAKDARAMKETLTD